MVHARALSCWGRGCTMLQISRLHNELIESAELSAELAKKLAEAELMILESRASGVSPGKDASG